MATVLARVVSTAGHPAVLLPAAVLVALPDTVALQALASLLACAALVLGYSGYKARRGDWGHIDASEPSERGEFNSRVAIGLVAAAAALWLAGLHVSVPVIVGLSGLIVATGHLCRRFAKLSLHAAFAAFAAVIVWPSHAAAAAMAFVALAVCWSPLYLKRHVRVDIAVGCAAGALAGLAYHRLVGQVAA